MGENAIRRKGTQTRNHAIEGKLWKPSVGGGPETPQPFIPSGNINEGPIHIPTQRLKGVPVTPIDEKYKELPASENIEDRRGDAVWKQWFTTLLGGRPSDWGNLLDQIVHGVHENKEHGKLSEAIQSLSQQAGIDSIPLIEGRLPTMSEQFKQSLPNIIRDITYGKDK